MKPKIFYLAWTPPNKASGATLAMRRHFIEHDDFEVFVATSGEFDEPGVPALRVRNPSWLDRIGRTRLWRLVRNYEIGWKAGELSRQLLEASAGFRPDAVFTVADLTLSESARRLSKRLAVPLITNFQDWWPRGQFYYAQERPFGWLVPHLEQRFRRLCRESALVFCTSEGMKEFLGPHPNSHVLYPIGARESVGGSSAAVAATAQTRSKRRLLYTGTAFGSYGSMLRSLAERLEHSPDWELVIYGARPDWPEDDLRKAEQTGLYRGFLPFERLKEELRAADACLSVMSFDPALDVMMRTSFTTKVLDYCSAGRPVIMWGPDFCSPVRLTKRHEAALTVESPDPSGVIACLDQLATDPGLGVILGEKASVLASTVLSHDAIHGTLVREIGRLLARGGA